MKKTKSKKGLAIKENGLSIRYQSVDTPGRDVSITIYKPYFITKHDVKDEEKKVKRVIKEWFNNSDSMESDHFIITTNVPNGYTTNAKRSMIFQLEMSVYLKEDVTLGRNNFPEAFVEDVDVLVELMK